MLLEALIVQACAGLIIPTDIAACSAALQAASIQTGTAQNVELAERYAADRANAEIQSRLDPATLSVLGFATKVVRDKSITGTVLRQRGPRPEVRTSVAPAQGQVDFNWRF